MLDHARAKLARKGCDLLVVNDVSGGKVFGADDNEAVMLGADGSAVERAAGSKAALAHVVWDEVARRTRWSERHRYSVRPVARSGRRLGCWRRDRPPHQHHATDNCEEKQRDRSSVHLRVRHRGSPRQDRRPDQRLRARRAARARPASSRVAVETLVTTGLVVVAGEVTHRGLRADRRHRPREDPRDRLRLVEEGLRRRLLRRAGRHRRASRPTSPRASTTATRSAARAPATRWTGRARATRA